MRVRFVIPGQLPEWRIVEMTEVPRLDEQVSFAEEGSRHRVFNVYWPLEDEKLASLPDDLRYEVAVELQLQPPKHWRD